MININENIGELYVGGKKIKEAYLGNLLLYSDDSPINLALRDIYGNYTKLTTANCYIIRKPGTYTFPCIYGNYYNNGVTNTGSFKLGTTWSDGMEFVDYKGNPITSGFLSGVISAQISLSDFNYNIIVNSPKIRSDSGIYYVDFTIREVPASGANFIISVLDASNIVIWSWHIWLWPYDLTTVDITNKAGSVFKILPVNLASRFDTLDLEPTHITNWYYQWGRPNPIPAAIAYNVSQYVLVSGALRFNTATTATSYNIGIQKPNIFYKGSTNWFGSNKYANLWGASQEGKTSIKTIYDPCPPGFKVPTNDVFSGISTNSIVGNFNNGLNFKKNSSDTTGLFFPAAGLIQSSNGIYAELSTIGYLWSANMGQCLCFNSSRVYNPTSALLPAAFPIRPVAE